MLAAFGGSQGDLEEKHNILLVAKYCVSPPNSIPFSPQSGGKGTVLIFSRVEYYLGKETTKTMSSKILLIVLFCCSWFLQIEAEAQCKYLNAPSIRRLARSSYSNKIERLYQKGAKQAIVNNEEDCKSSTFVDCQNYIGDEQWHWAEIISFNSCDQILTYSTSNQQHFNNIKNILTKRYEFVGTRTYSDLVFKVFQDKKARVIEINEHPNQEGIMFYLINIIRARAIENRG